MESLHQSDSETSAEKPRIKDTYKKGIALLVLGILAFFAFFDVDVSVKPRLLKSKENQVEDRAGEAEISALEKRVIPKDGITLPVRWGDLGVRMVKAGVIDEDKFAALYQRRGGLEEDMQKLLQDSNNGAIRMDEKNAGVILNLLWAFGLANKNTILEEGPMQDPRYGGADRFASTGGWTLAKGDVMDYYSKYSFVPLTPEQQALVERVSKNIYRPCCGNATYFPDCNHGMAMLGLLELMAAQGTSEEDMYSAALLANSYWFPDTYLTIAKYFEKRGVEWNKVNPKEILGSAYSSSAGYRQILTEVEPPKTRRGGGCGV